MFDGLNIIFQGVWGQNGRIRTSRFRADDIIVQKVWGGNRGIQRLQFGAVSSKMLANRDPL